MDTAQEVIAAIFADRTGARASIEALEQEGFSYPWMAVTRLPDEDHDDASGAAGASENEVAEASDGVLGAIGRFFSGEGNSLRRALEGHGLSDEDADDIDASMSPGNAVVVVKSSDRIDAAAHVLTQNGGRVHRATSPGSYAYDVNASTGSTFAGAGLGDAALGGTTLGGSIAGISAMRHSGMGDAMLDDTSLSDIDASGEQYDDATLGTTERLQDDTQRLELREERLRIDKQTVSAGEVTLGKRIETERASVDVPVFREEVFIERRPVAGGRPTSGTIGDDTQTISVPLSREEVRVEKQAFVREEVSVGKRRVEESQRVDETLRREELVTDAPADASFAGRGDLTGTTHSTPDPLL